MVMPNYQAQYQRAQRYYERFKRINDGLASTCDICLDDNNMEDDVRSFFIHCYHVRDWIKNDDDAPDCMRRRIGSFIEESEPMKICADLCNGIKHLKRNRRTRTGSQPYLSGKDTEISIVERIHAADSARVSGESISEPSPIETGEERKKSPAPIVATGFGIRVGEKTHDAFTVATQAMEAWKTFIRENGGDC